VAENIKLKYNGEICSGIWRIFKDGLAEKRERELATPVAFAETRMQNSKRIDNIDSAARQLCTSHNGDLPPNGRYQE